MRAFDEIDRIGPALQRRRVGMAGVGHLGAKALAVEGSAAAPLFYRYGAAARTPQTKSKGFYWAGEAASYAGDAAGARRYYEMAAAYPEYFYGQLALELEESGYGAFGHAPAQAVA